jgi:RNA polymerase sigma-70 factor (ECF subfamily)
MRDEVRRAVRRPAGEELTEAQPDPTASPLELAMGKEAVERYETALLRLRPRDREAVVGRIELQYSYEELALALDLPTANAARMAAARALERLVKAMNDGT